MVKTSVILLLCAGSLVSHSFAREDRNDDGPSSASPITAWAQGTDTLTGEPVKLYFKKEYDTEIVLQDLKDVSVHCEAEFPVELDFKSHGGFKLLATGSGSSSKSFMNGTHDITVQKYTTYAHLVSLKGLYTGMYTCLGRSSENKHNTISAFIFVPTDKLFISTKTAAISLLGQSPLIIRCPVSDPSANVTLVKLHEEDTIKPVPAATYNPRIGFFLNGTESNDPNLEGTYYCIAKTEKYQRALEFVVMKGPVSCTQKCTENAQCQMVNDQQVCECKPHYKETLVSEKCIYECRTDRDCPVNMACMPQESGSFLLDILISSEGRTASDDEEDQPPRIGECKNPCIFRTTTCSLTAFRNANEECQVVDHKAVCSVPSDGEGETTTEK